MFDTYLLFSSKCKHIRMMAYSLQHIVYLSSRMEKSDQSVVIMSTKSRPELVCCCFGNLKGCIVIACFYGGARIIYFITLFFLAHKSLGYNKSVQFIIVTEIYLGLSLIADILLLIGSIKKIKRLLIPWMVFAGIWIALSIPLHIHITIMSGIFQTVIATIIGLALTIWAMFLVYGGVKEIEFETSINTEQRHLETP